MGDVQNIHDLQLMYGTYATNSRHMECATDHSRLLPGGPCSSEGSTVATNVLSPH